MRSPVPVTFLLLVLASCGGGDSTSPGGTSGGGNTGGTGGSGGSSSAPVSTNQVGVSDDVFTPPNIQIARGTTVTWTWAPDARTHNVTFTDGVHSDELSAGSYQRRFDTAGKFNYSCTLHVGMNGSVTVQ